MTGSFELHSEFLTSDEVCNLFKISRRTLHRWARLRKGPPSIKVGRAVFFRRASVEQWLLSQEQPFTICATVARLR